MNTNFDFELILTCKRYNPPSITQQINNLREVWAARCDININEVYNIHIALHLIQIADAIYESTNPHNLRITNIISELSPANDWKYQDSGMVVSFWERVLLIYAGGLAQTKTACFDGLDYYFENIWKKAGKP